MIMQQGSSGLIESRVNLRQWTKNFAAEIRKVNAQPSLYMVYGRSLTDRGSQYGSAIRLWLFIHLTGFIHQSPVRT